MYDKALYESGASIADFINVVDCTKIQTNRKLTAQFFKEPAIQPLLNQY